MSTFYLVNTVRIGTTTLFAGSYVDDSVTSTTAMVAAGALLWPSADATVAAAATVAQNARKYKGASERECDAIMTAAVDSVQKSLSSTATGSGASEIGIEDAGSLITATTVEGALAELAPALPVRIQKKTVTLSAAVIAAAGAVMVGTFNVGTALPAGARVLGATVNVATKVQNAGDTDTEVLDVGIAGTTELWIKDADCKVAGLKGPNSATGFLGRASGADQVIATLTSSVNLSTVTAGSVVIDVFYFVLA